LFLGIVVINTLVTPPSNGLAEQRSQLERQVAHWVAAANALRVDDLAAPEAWRKLERYMGLALRNHLTAVITRLCSEVELLKVSLLNAESPTALRDVQHQLLGFRHKYLRTETTLDFFADAINTRTSADMAATLRACDIIAHRSMALILDPLGVTAPPVLCYLDKGLGASMLKAGMRLWDGGKENPVAAIKIARHNLLRPTALIHEAGHQVAYLTGWNTELADTFKTTLIEDNPELARVWASWASEIAADAIAFVHTGFASLAALHDVLAGDPRSVMQFHDGDPHPISYLRVLFNVEMCRLNFGRGPWDTLAVAWVASQPLHLATAQVQALITQSIPLLTEIAKGVLQSRQRSFRGRSLSELIPPERVSPRELSNLRNTLGPSLYTSSHWLWTECLRSLAFTGWAFATKPSTSQETLKMQRDSMIKLGMVAQTI
jgi:hypothetical protein